MDTITAKDTISNLQDCRNLLDLTTDVSDRDKLLSIINAVMLILDMTILDLSNNTDTSQTP